MPLLGHSVVNLTFSLFVVKLAVRNRGFVPFSSPICGLKCILSTFFLTGLYSCRILKLKDFCLWNRRLKTSFCLFFRPMAYDMCQRSLFVFRNANWTISYFCENILIVFHVLGGFVNKLQKMCILVSSCLSVCM